MGKLQSKSNGNYILEVKIGNVTLQKAFKNSDIPLEEVVQLPSTDDFYLYIPDVRSKSDQNTTEE